MTVKIQTKSTTTPARLSDRQACEYLLTNHGITKSPGSLRVARCIKASGPAWLKIAGRVFYEPAALDEWATAVTAHHPRITA